MAFDRTARPAAVPEDPEALYRKLAPTNRGPDSLWGHQTDLLRDWHKTFRNNADVALELPTGAGKTLVGGLIAEWVRQSERQPVAYLCPNRQLAAQTAERLGDYGIPAVLLTSRVRQWNRADRSRFTTGGAIAVSTYSHVFNSNPALTGAGTLVFDDAHAGDQPVAAAWALTVERNDAAYQTVLSVLADALDPVVVTGLRDDNSVQRYRKTVYLASPVIVAAKAPELERTLEDAVANNALDNQGYVFSTLAGHVGRCLVYVSFRRILIRPLISPTGTHAGFDDPRRRVYMSATLGAGGELERAFGREHIDRIPVPKGWDKQGTGRRFFVFPELTTDLAGDEDGLAPWLSTTIARHGRAALLTPAKHVSDVVLDQALPAGYTRLDGHAVENDMTLFTREQHAVLDLANRYDGVDLPDDECRLLVLAGLPAQGDLQERFLYETLGAGAVLQERVRARIAQGAGRATRNTKDHATVVILGDDLVNFLLRRNVLAALREELQAEIRFGHQQSLDKQLADMNDNIDLFLAQGAEWREVEADIVAERDTLTRTDPPGTGEFAAAARHEVAAIHAWWDDDLESALRHARKVLDVLDVRPATRRYAALWHYLAASWSRVLAVRTGDPDEAYVRAADAYLADARAAGRGTTWLSHLAAAADAITGADQYDALDREAAANIVRLLRGWTRKDETELAQAKSDLAQTRATAYEAGLKRLGRFAGAAESYAAEGGHGAPDASWIFSDQLWVAWEAKSEADNGSTISKRYVLEAGGHLAFIATRQGKAAPAGSFSCYATPQKRLDNTAKSVCGDEIYHLPLHTPADLLARVDRALAAARRLGAGVDEAGVLASLKAENCLPTQWVQEFTAQPLNRLGTEAP